MGVVFSASNASRMAFEMRACGLKVVELDNEFTRPDLPADQFLLVEASAEAVADAVVALLGGGGGGFDDRHDAYWRGTESYDEAAQFLRHMQDLLALDEAALP